RSPTLAGVPLRLVCSASPTLAPSRIRRRRRRAPARFMCRQRAIFIRCLDCPARWPVDDRNALRLAPVCALLLRPSPLHCCYLRVPAAAGLLSLRLSPLLLLLAPARHCADPPTHLYLLSSLQRLISLELLKAATSSSPGKAREAIRSHKYNQLEKLSMKLLNLYWNMLRIEMWKLFSMDLANFEVRKLLNLYWNMLRTEMWKLFSMDLANFEMVQDFRKPLLDVLEIGLVDLCFVNEDKGKSVPQGNS
ncbi:hypothetical protein Taro_024394, partial [Colocasia esculenta]|nr:hypothetical protein [Colocasia esculenta]